MIFSRKSLYVFALALLSNIIVVGMFALMQTPAEATEGSGLGCRPKITFSNHSSESVNVYWKDRYDNERHHYTLQSGHSYEQRTRKNRVWVVRDLDGHELVTYKARCHNDHVEIHDETPEPTVTPPAECEACVSGVKTMTIELKDRTHGGDKYERIRARVGGVDGEVLFDTWDDGNPYGHGGLFEGESFTIDIPASGEDVVITVQGDYHPHETVKATFGTSCDAYVGNTSGNSYIKFKVIDIEFDNEEGLLCAPLSLGNFVWRDDDPSTSQPQETDGDGILNGNEPPIEGVIVELWVGSDPATATFTGLTTTTNINGEYEFTNLLPDDYIVVVPESNFEEDAALWQLNSSIGNNLPVPNFTAPDPDDDVDNDDNGTVGSQLGITNSTNDSLISDDDVLSKPVTLSYGDEPNGGFDNPTVDFSFKDPD